MNLTASTEHGECKSMLNRIRPLVFLLAIALPTSAIAQIRYTPVTLEKIKARLSEAKFYNEARAKKLKSMFAEAACPQLSDGRVKGHPEPNIICVLPGKSAKTIVVGAHFDHVPVGEGVVDNWSGASLLPTLLESVLPQERTHTIVFVGFSAEENGLVGSRAYVKDLTAEQRANVSAMVNLDTLGLSPTKVWESHANPGLVNAIIHLATAMKLPLTLLDVEKVGSTDSESFRAAKIPSIAIHSLTQETLPILHTHRDTMKAIKLDDYYQTYQLLAAYLMMLDQGLDRPQQGAGQQATGTN